MLSGHRQKVLLENSVGPATNTDRRLAAMTDGVAAKSNGRLSHVAISSNLLASMLLKETMMPCCGEQHPEVVVAEVVDVGQRSVVRAGALPTPVPRPLTTSHVELGEHPLVVLGCVEPPGHRTGDVEVVAAGDVPDRQLLDKAFQRGGFPLVLRWFVTH